MPVLQRRQQMLAPMQGASKRDSTDSIEREHLWVVEEDYEQRRKEMDFPTTKLSRQPPQKKSRNTLRINTHPNAELHERYQSSEEEPSPSPSETIENHDEPVRHKSSTGVNDTIDLSKVTESKAEIAVAVPIMAIGRPKLIDITNLAPLHKRKRVSQPPAPHSLSKKVTSTSSNMDVENMPSLNRDPADMFVPKRKPIAPKRQDSLRSFHAPETWLPEEDPEALEADEHYFPLDVRPTPAYRDYDPYSLEPPRLSRTNSPTSMKEVVRARVSSNPPLTVNTARFKGLTRSLSLANRQGAQPQRSLVKKPKMVARGANEREDMLTIPPFPFEEGIAAN